jgi:hypothetical protein
VQWGGKLPGAESWSCGIRLRKKVGFTVIADAAPLLAGVGAAIEAMHSNAGTQIGSNAKLSFVKCNAIGIDGRYLDTSGTNIATYADVAGGGGTTPNHPNQIALAVTWTTGYSRGPAHKGRTYLPLPIIGVDSAGLIAAANAGAVSDVLDTFLTSLNAVSSSYEAAVFSRNAVTPGNRKITGNKVGRVLDTQRRRRRSLVENYQ